MEQEIMLYLECPDQNKGEFLPEKELSEGEYLRMLQEYSNSLNSLRNNPNSRYNFVDEAKYQNKVKDAYLGVKTTIFDITGHACGLRYLYDIEKRGSGVIIVDLATEAMDDVFEEEFRMWKQESMRFNNEVNLSDEERIRFLPSKNLKLGIDYHMFLLQGCKIYHVYDDFKVAILIQKIKEI